MSQRAVTITSLPMAFEVLKAMRKGRPWIGARVIVQSAPQRVLSTDLLTELGDIELNVPGPAATARPRLFAPMRGARGDRPGHPRRLRARPIDAQGGRDVGGPHRLAGAVLIPVSVLIRATQCPNLFFVESD